jgi:hypothetical protein
MALPLAPSIRLVYGQVWLLRQALLRLSAIWFFLALVGLLLTGQADMMNVSLDGSLQRTLGSILHLFAVLAAWYCAHRYLLAPTQKVDYLPSPRQGRFVATQLGLILGLSLVAGLIIAPLSLAAMPALDANLPPEELQAAANEASRKFAPLVFAVMLWLFSRLMLGAPFMVRDVPQALRRSWRATKGHWLRLLALQVAVLVPMIAGSALALALGKIIPLLGMLCSTVGLFISLMLYTQLAENEFAILTKEPPHV